MTVMMVVVLVMVLFCLFFFFVSVGSLESRSGAIHGQHDVSPDYEFCIIYSF